ncbi:exonuclease SbcCD subunit D [Rothia halotolerans]|uniref:exonuclease SbcCD subunit D n=1 Tax=Rothia halotolerans TaxID=405770 RepID=UPI00101C1C7C|nr:exonuclease SbcCD subunit D [Rothia halotolerans]
MRILHTSDLHLGRSFHGRSLFDDQEIIHRELIRVCQDRGVDAVLVAGDVYDQASPRTEVIDQFSRLLTELARRGVQVVLTSGNHDSAARLGFASGILETAGVHLRTRLEDCARPVELSEDVLVYGIPYLDPRASASRLDVEPTHGEVLRAALDAAREDFERRPHPRAVVMAHCFATGAEPTDSERILASGNLGAVPASLFEGFDYAALGHLHGRQRLREAVRYSGSPLRFSFSETRQTKGYWLVDVDAEGVSVEGGRWEHQLPLAQLRGSLEELLQDPAHAWAEESLCQVTLTDAERPAHPMERLRARFPQTLELAFSGLRTQTEVSYSRRMAAARTPGEACEAFYDRVRGRMLDEEEQTVLEAAVAEAVSLEAGEHEGREDASAAGISGRGDPSGPAEGSSGRGEPTGPAAARPSDEEGAA